MYSKRVLWRFVRAKDSLFGLEISSKNGSYHGYNI